MIIYPVSHRVVRPTITLDTSAYTSGDALHDGYLTLLATDNGGHVVKLTKILVKDKEANNPALRAYIFNKAPTATITKNAAYAPSDADLDYLEAVVDIAAGTALSANSYKDLVLSVPVPIKPGGSDKNLYVVLALTAGTPTWASATSLSVSFYFETV